MGAGHSEEAMMQEQWYILGSIVVVLCGIVFGSSRSAEVFGQTVAASGVPTPTRYLVRRWPFMIGKLAFTAFCLLAYLFALIFYRELPALVDLMPGVAKAALGDYVNVISDKSHPSLLAITIAVTAGFLCFVKNDFPGNVVYSFRGMMYATISVTFAYDRIRERLLNSLTVPDQERSALAQEPNLGVLLTYFDLHAADIDRQWAELAYMRDWVEKARASGNDIFVDRNFDFDRSHNQFIALRELVRGCRSGKLDAEACASMASILREVREQYARYMSCLLLTSSTTRLSLHDACSRAGIEAGPLTVENPVFYSASYLITLAVSVVLGPYLSAVGYDLWSGINLWTALVHQDIGYMQRWLIKGLAVYFTPICVILLVRNVLWRLSPVRSYSSLATYGWILLLAFGTSCIGGVLISLFVYPGGGVDGEQVVTALWANAPWSISPALTSIYINYYLDRQADPAKEDIVQIPGTFVARLLSAFGFTLTIVIFTILIVAYQHFAGNIWSLEETRVVVVGTVALITISLCLVAQFGLRKQHAGSRPATTPMRLIAAR
jgi:hypothetical protein